MNNEKEKLELLGWMIMRGNSIKNLTDLLNTNQEYCKLSIKAINYLPKEEFAKGKKQPYIDMIMKYTNHKEDGKFKHQKEDLISQSEDVDGYITLLWNNLFSPKPAFTYYKGFAKIFEEISSYEATMFVEGDREMLNLFLETPALSKEFVSLMKNTPEELAQKITEGNGDRSKIVAALKEDYWIHIGRYWEPFGIKKGDYLISNSDFEFLFEVNQLILKKVFQKKEVISDLSMDLIRLCARLSKYQQLEILESLEDANNARINVGNDTGKSKIRLLANMTDYLEVKSQIRFKFPDMQIAF